MLVTSIVVAIGIVFLILKSTKNDAVGSKPISTSSDNFMVLNQVKEIMTTSDWINGQAQWSRYLEVSACTENQCVIKAIFSSPQICPEGAASDDWCDEVELSGKMQFVKEGFQFIEDKKSDAVFCELKAGGAEKQWLLEGPLCPSEFKQLLGSQK